MPPSIALFQQQSFPDSAKIKHYGVNLKHNYSIFYLKALQKMRFEEAYEGCWIDGVIKVDRLEIFDKLTVLMPICAP